MSSIVKGGGGAAKQEKTVTAGTYVKEVLPDTGKLLSKVVVNPTPTEEKTVTPTTSQQTVSPTEGYHIAKVIVEAMEDVTPEVTAQTPIIAEIAEKFGVSITTPSGSNKQILQGNNTNLQSFNQNVTPKDAEIITPGTEDIIIPLGTYLRGDLKIAGDQNLIPANIKLGANIFGVNGTPGGSGLNVWKKFEFGGVNYNETNVSDFEIYSGNGDSRFTRYYAKSYEYDIATEKFILINPVTKRDYFDGVKKAFNDNAPVYIIDGGSVTSGDLLYEVESSDYVTVSSTKMKLVITGKQFSASVDLTPSCFIVDDDVSTYPDKAVHTDGFYYELLGQISSANVMSLSDDALETVQSDYRNTIVQEVQS